MITIDLFLLSIEDSSFHVEFSVEHHIRFGNTRQTVKSFDPAKRSKRTID